MKTKEKKVLDIMQLSIDYNEFHCSKNDFKVGIGRVLEEYANTKAIKWTPIDKDNLPKEMILMVDLKKKAGIEYGWLNEYTATIYTHYQLVNINKIQL